jgi:integrase
MTKADANAYLAAAETQIRRGAWIDPWAARMRFADWAEEWRASIVDLRPSTKARDLGYLERYVLPRFGELELRQIDHMAIRAWVAELSASGLAPATTTKAAQLLGKIMKSAVQAGLLLKSPGDGVRLPRIERVEMRFLDASEVRALAAGIDPRYKAAVLLAAYGGLRAGELFGLRAKRVDPLRRTVTIAETLVDVGGHPYFGPPKTRAGHRTIPLPRVAADPLAEHLAAYGRKPDDLVFTAPEGGPVQLNVWRRRFWAPAVRAAGLSHLRPHDLRHTAVALWKMSNVAVFASFHPVRDEVPPGDMNLSGNEAVRSSRDEDLVGVGIHHSCRSRCNIDAPGRVACECTMLHSSS